jgi:hypothetical protein
MNNRGSMVGTLLSDHGRVAAGALVGAIAAALFTRGLLGESADSGPEERVAIREDDAPEPVPGLVVLTSQTPVVSTVVSSSTTTTTTTTTTTSKRTSATTTTTTTTVVPTTTTTVVPTTTTTTRTCRILC